MLRARSRFVCGGGVDDGGGGEGFCGEPNGLSVMVGGVLRGGGGTRGGVGAGGERLAQ